jgi:hypothetical protein
MRRLADRALWRFAEWFSDSGGVWQTFVLCLVIVALESLHVIPDEHGFWLLYWLTVYSAVTQPALAYSGRLSSNRIEEKLAAILLSEEHLNALAEAMARPVAAQVAQDIASPVAAEVADQVADIIESDTQA